MATSLIKVCTEPKPALEQQTISGVVCKTAGPSMNDMALSINHSLYHTVRASSVAPTPSKCPYLQHSRRIRRLRPWLLEHHSRHAFTVMPSLALLDATRYVPLLGLIPLLLLQTAILSICVVLLTSRLPTMSWKGPMSHRGDKFRFCDRKEKQSRKHINHSQI